MTLAFNSWTKVGIGYEMALHFSEKDHTLKPYFASPGVHRKMVMKKINFISSKSSGGIRPQKKAWNIW